MIAASRVVSVALIVCATVLASPFATPLKAQQEKKRVVRVGVTNPATGGPELQIATREGEAASLTIPDVGSFKLVPSFRKGDDKNVLLTITDADSGRHIDQMELPIGGQPVHPKSLPFRVRIRSVTTPK